MPVARRCTGRRGRVHLQHIARVVVRNGQGRTAARTVELQFIPIPAEPIAAADVEHEIVIARGHTLKPVAKGPTAVGQVQFDRVADVTREASGVGCAALRQLKRGGVVEWQRRVRGVVECPRAKRQEIPVPKVAGVVGGETVAGGIGWFKAEMKKRARVLALACYGVYAAGGPDKTGRGNEPRGVAIREQGKSAVAC